MHNTRIGEQLRQLHDAVLDIVGIVNRPDRDELLIRTAGIRLDRALFPLIVLVERFGPIGVVELAGRVGRDHSTVSRQIARLVDLGLVERRTSDADRRSREAVATEEGRAMARRIDGARERLGRLALAGWSADEIDMFIRMTRRFADALEAGPGLPSND